MAKELYWHTQGQILMLYGELDRDTLLILWHKRQLILKGIRLLDVANLQRIDSAGVAIMLHLCHYQYRLGFNLALTGVTGRLRTLIELYNLHEILPCTKAANS